jgi:hypothetical protein
MNRCQVLLVVAVLLITATFEYSSAQQTTDECANPDGMLYYLRDWKKYIIKIASSEYV